MRKLETYHYTFEEGETQTHTFEIGVKPYALLVKNLTNGNISFSYGTEIDTENDSYSELPKYTAELFGYPYNDDETTITATVQAEGTGLVELRVVDY